MVEWWEGNLDLFATMKLNREDFMHLVLESRILFRNGIQEMMDTAKRLKIPFLIVSGGITEIIESSFLAILHNGEIQSPHAI